VRASVTSAQILRGSAARHGASRVGALASSLQGSSGMGYRKILAAIDFSVASGVALREAAELASKFGAELTLVHVRPGATLGSLARKIDDDRLMPSASALEQQLLREWKDQAIRRSERPVHTLELSGVPWESIVAQAREGDFDLIVMGSHGASGLGHALLGSVAERVVAHAPCPVFVVRPKSR
jgi:glycine betaine transporter